MTLEIAELGELISISKGRKAPEVFGSPAPNSKRYIQINDLRTDEKITYAFDSSGVEVNSSDLCIAWDGANAGTVGYGLTGYIGSTIARLRPKQVDQFFTPYVGRFLQSKFKVLNEGTTGATIPHVSKDKLISLIIPLPPLTEQKRIAAILDKADSIRRKRQEAVRLAEDLLRSVFLDMFGDPVTNPKGWETRAFADACEARLGKMLDANQQTGEHLRPYLRNSNVQWDRIETSDLEQMDFNEKDRNTFSLKDGDVLICEGGEVGRAAIWRNQLTDCYFQKAIHRARPKQSLVLPEYVMFWLWFMAKNGGFKDHVTSATIAHLTGEKLKEIQMALPPIAIQHHFLGFYNSLTNLKMSTNKHQAETDTLFNTLLHRAFEGEV